MLIHLPAYLKMCCGLYEMHLLFCRHKYKRYISPRTSLVENNFHLDVWMYIMVHTYTYTHMKKYV